MFQTEETFARNIKIYGKRLKGVRYSALAKEYGLSSQRVRQIFETMKARQVKNQSGNSTIGKQKSRAILTACNRKE